MYKHKMGNDNLDLNLDNGYDFFNGCRLALIKADVPHYKLVNEINKAFNFNLKREPQLDIVIYSETEQINLENITASELIATTAHPIIEDKYFPLHRYVYPHSSIEMFVISNQVEGDYLITDLQYVDYYFIIRHAESLTFDDDVFTLLAQVAAIKYLKEVDITTFEYKSYLQFE